MTEFIEILTHGRRLKAQLKTLTIDELRDVFAKMQDIVNEREAEAEEESAANAERIAKIEALRKMMAEDGISVDDLGVNVDTKSRKKRAPRPAKYKYILDGEEHTWTGQGRMPKTINEQIKSGEKSLEDFLI
ncbi:MAG: H-NS family nucleoid-associated regulatory protein [Ferrimonas sp.]